MLTLWQMPPSVTAFCPTARKRKIPAVCIVLFFPSGLYAISRSASTINRPSASSSASGIVIVTGLPLTVSVPCP